MGFLWDSHAIPLGFPWDLSGMSVGILEDFKRKNQYDVFIFSCFYLIFVCTAAAVSMTPNVL